MKSQNILDKIPNEALHGLYDRLDYFNQLGGEFVVPPDPASGDLESLAAEVRACRKCRLCEKRKHAVPGEGRSQADLMFVGEGPGHDEDLQGRPFVGKAGQLLTKIIGVMGFRRPDVYITNIVKCRPPENRDPHDEEIESCRIYLERQIDLIRPRVIVALGNVSARYFLNTAQGITSLRGRFSSYRDIPVMPTFHPSYLVRNERNRNLRRKVWEDMQQVMAVLAKK